MKLTLANPRKVHEADPGQPEEGAGRLTWQTLETHRGPG